MVLGGGLILIGEVPLHSGREESRDGGQGEDSGGQGGQDPASRDTYPDPREASRTYRCDRHQEHQERRESSSEGHRGQRGPLVPGL